MNRRIKLGRTEAFPDGKIDETDEGELRIAVSFTGGIVRIDFGTPVAWIGLSANGAKELAAALMKYASSGVQQ